MPVRVTNVDIEADIEGSVTETCVTIVLHNPNGRVLEGELEFPLPADATVSGYALDVNGRMVDGVIVEKEKARAVFDEVVRQGIDPGLAEQIGGNMFRTKVYPLPANGNRTVKVRYVSATQSVTENGQRVSYYVQPLNYPDKLESFKLKLNVAAAIEPPKVIAGSLSNLEFSKWKTVYTAKTELKDIALTEDLYVAIMTRPEESFLYQTAADGKRYFAYDYYLNSSDLSVVLPRAKEPVIVWDASMSREKSDHAQEFAFLKAAFGKADKLSLIIFRNEAEKPLVFANVDELVKALESVIYDGATNMAAAVGAVPAGADAYLFSDGLDNYSIAPASTKAARLCVFTSDKQQNAPVLRKMAVNGSSFDLRNVALDEVLKLLDVPVPAVTSIMCDGKELDAVWQFRGNRLSAAGILPDGAKKLSFAMSVGGKNFSKDAVVSESAAVLDGQLLKINYGQLKINDLIATSADSTKIVAAGKEFGLVTPGTSLLVLDTYEQYLRYSIRPPETLPELRKRYDEEHPVVAKDSQWGESFKLQQRSPEEVLSTWKALIAWYERDFSKVIVPPKKAVTEDGMVAEETAAPRPGILRRMLNSVALAAPPRTRAVEAEVVVDGGAVESADRAVAMPAPEPAAAGAPDVAGSTTASLKAWNPDTPYLQAMKNAGNDSYQAYIKQRAEYGESAGFYMDCADFFEKAGMTDVALRVLSNLAEMDLENKQVLRILGYKLRFMKQYPYAELVFRQVIALAPEEPQSYRDLALTLDDMERYQDAVDMMMNVVNFKFNSRFPEIEVIALTEINRMILRAERSGVTIKNVDKRFIQPIETDIRVVINWDTDMSDMDLWVTDAMGEKCFYSHRFTSTGGRNSCDFTQGYGPEEFMIRKARNGKYKVQTDYYGTHTQKVLGAVTLYAEVFTNYGRKDETRQFLAYRLDSRKQVIDVAVIDHEGISTETMHAEPFNYQVKKGDTLESISKALYGDASYIDDIIAANPGLTKDGNLKIGGILNMPASRK